MNSARAALALPAAVLAFVGGLSFGGAFELGGIWRMCLGCAVIPAVIVAAAGTGLGRGRVPPLPATVAVSVLAWAAAVPALATALAVVTAPVAAGAPVGWLAVLRAAVTNAPKTILTTEPPAPLDPVLLASIGTLVWWAAAWSAEAALRSRSGLLAALPPAVVLVAGTASGVPRGSASQLWPAGAFLAVLTCMLAAHRALSGDRARRGARPGGPRADGAGRVLVVLGTCAAVTGIAVVLVPALPGLASRPPADPRSLLRPPSRVQSVIDPLSLVTAWLSGRPRLLFTVRTGDPVNFRWLVLDQYNGRDWTSAADYLPAGSKLPGPAGAGAVTTRPVTESVQIVGLPGTLLPAVDRPAALAGVAVRVDPASSMLATLDGGPARGLAYQVTSDIPEPSLIQLENAVPGADSSVAGQRLLPAGLPPAVAAYGTSAMAGAASPYQQMLLLQGWLLRDFTYEPNALPGESYGQLWYFVAKHRVGGPGVFATLFAVLARHAGFAARIAIGFLPGRQVAPGRYQVTTADVLVWPEVYFRGLGWVPFYPLPKPGTGKNGAAVRPLGQPGRMTRLNQQVTRSQHARGPGGGHTVGPHRPAGPGGPGALMVLALVLAGLAAVGGGYLIVAAFARARISRRWRRGADPRERVAGAWQYALSGLTAAAGPSVLSLTPDEIVGRAAEVAGPAAREPATVLAGLANAALFGPAPPAPEAAVAAVSAARQFRRLAERRVPLRARTARLIRTAPAGYERGWRAGAALQRWSPERFR